MTRALGAWMVEVDDPDGKEAEPGAGDGTGDIEGLDGEEAAEEGTELPLDGDPSSA